MKKNIFLLSALFLSFSLGNLSFACPADKTAHCPCVKQKDVVSSLNLTKEQQAAVHAIKKQAREETRPLYQQLKEVKAQINALTQADTLEQNKLNTLIKQSSSLKAQILRLHTLAKQRVYSTLNPSQKQQYRKLTKS